MIEGIFGAMFSGKSTVLFQRLERAVFAKKKVALIRPVIDNRGYITHSSKNSLFYDLIKEKKIDLIITTHLDTDLIKRLTSRVSGYDVIGVDEFFMIKNCIGLAQQVHTNQQVYFAGLLASSELKVFKEVLDILPYCDRITKLNGVCENCQSELGNYSFYKEGTKNADIEVGDNNKYLCLCKDCFIQGELAKENGGIYEDTDLVDKVYRIDINKNHIEYSLS